MMHVKGYLEYCGVFSTVGNIMSTMVGFLSTMGDTQYCGGIMMHVGDIMSTVGVFSTMGEESFVI